MLKENRKKRKQLLSICLVAVLSFCMASESQAIKCISDGLSDKTGSDENGNSCESCGVNCSWEITDNHELLISATNTDSPVTMRNFTLKDSVVSEGYETNISSDAPWARLGITSVNVGEGIQNIGAFAFRGEEHVTNVSMPSVSSIGSTAFSRNTALTDIYMPNVTSIGDYAFAWAENLEYVNLKKIKTIGQYAFFGNFSLSSIEFSSSLLKVIGENAFSSTKIRNCSINNPEKCVNCENRYMKKGLGCINDCGAGYLGKEGICIDAANGCGENYRQIENWCNRIRYTPTEAAAVLHDDNTNSVTITFKK